MRDADTGKSRGFGFVQYDNVAEADTAMQAMNGSELVKSTPLT